MVIVGQEPRTSQRVTPHSSLHIGPTASGEREDSEITRKRRGRLGIYVRAVPASRSPASLSSRILRSFASAEGTGPDRGMLVCMTREEFGVEKS